MDKPEVEQFLEALGSAPKFTGGHWVGCRCPLAPWNHKGGVDNNPSSGVSINASGLSWFHCWTCQEKMPLLPLIMKIRKLRSELPAGDFMDLRAAYNLAVCEEDDISDELGLDGIGDYEANKKAKLAKKYITHAFGEAWFQSFSPVTVVKVAMDYLSTRKQKFSAEMLLKYEVVYDSMQKRIAVPTRSFDGTLCGLHGRAIHDDIKPRYFAYGYHGLRNPHIWMGEHFVDLDKDVIITEGMFDMMSIARVYPNVLASRSSEIQEGMYSRIDAAPRIVTFYDYGTGGDVCRRKIDKRFSSHDIVHIVPDEEEDDAGDMSVGAIKELLSQAEIV